MAEIDVSPPTSIRAVFNQVLEAPAEDRERLLNGLAAEVRAEVVSLLNADQGAGNFLDLSAPGLATGERIGPYLVVERIGQGGMGAVYRARRDDGEFQREVAIKFVEGRSFAPEAERRFIIERRILARLNHPAIVRMFDGGIWQGRHYLVMELVSGTPITQYCCEQQLAISQRLRLFQQVCSAIQHAHQNLVIHRDLKAADILVAGDGQVKVLDFGIAQLLEEGDGSKPGSTALHPMTLSSASPEQLRGEAVTVASDIYSLGLLLCELLTGRNPQAEGSHAEIAHRVLHEDPVPPGKRVAGLSRDLDAIVLKALAKTPAERYASAAEMSADVENFLERRPVRAQRPSAWYHAKRFFARNPALTVISVALVMAIVTAGAAMLSSLTESRRGARRFNDVRGMAHSTLFDVYDSISTLPGSLPARRLVASRAQQYLDSLAQDAGDNPPLALDLAESYLRLADVRGGPYHPNLGDTAGALQSYDKARTMLAEQAAHHPNDVAIQERLAQAYMGLSRVYTRQGNYQAAMDVGQQAIELARALCARTPQNTAYRAVLSEAYAYVAEAQNSVGVQTGSMEMLQQSLETSQKSLETMQTGDPPLEEWWQASLSRKYFRVGYSLRSLGERTGDVAYHRRALEAGLHGIAITRALAEKHPEQPSRTLADDLCNLGMDRWQCCRDFHGAMRDFREALGTFEQIASADPQNVEARRDIANVRVTVGNVLADAGRRKGALSSYRKAVAILEELDRADPTSQENASFLATTRARLAKAELAGRTGKPPSR